MKRNKESTGNTQNNEGKMSIRSRGSEGIRIVQEVKGIERATGGKGIQGVERVMGGKGIQGVERVMGGKEVWHFFVRY